jgi:hypothetical protein
MVHVALRLRSDIQTHQKDTGFSVNEEEMIACVPESVFMFIRLMFGGLSLLEGDQEDMEEGTTEQRETNTQTRVLSIAQDLVYNVTGGKHLTPKHVGLASTLHQATRSRELVQLFHNAGHTVSYHSLLQIDTALAESTLEAMDQPTGAVTPPNFAHNRFVHFTCDNIDINDSSLDGKQSFHATQVAAWQRGPEADIGMQHLKPSQQESIQVPEVMEQLFPAKVIQGKAEPTLTTDTQKDWFDKPEEDSRTVTLACAQDMAFFLDRQSEGETKQGWTSFNQSQSKVSPEMTSIGYMPLVQAPAHDLDTLNTVVVRCKHVARKLGQHHVVLTVDEALFCKLMELKWAKDEYQDFLIIRLGGLHTAMNFLKVIGKHIQSSGLLESWVESTILGPKSAEQVLAGKSYSRGMRAHKMTLQAMWRILLPQLLLFIEDKNPDLKSKMDEKEGNSTTEDLISLLAEKDFRDAMEAFLATKENPNFKFWWSYMQMVQILLLFTRAQRDGIWELHLSAFQSMLPYFMRYNHTNYARWGTVYLNEMHQLPPEVKSEFDAGNFVVKRTPHRFNQVDPDQSQEWLNAVGKKGGGIIGITKTSSALSRWALSYNLRSHLALETRAAFAVGSSDDIVHNETTRSRMKRDTKDEDKLLTTLKCFKLFSSDMPHSLQNIATKDLVTEAIEADLLSAERKGQEQLNSFVEERLVATEQRKVMLRDPLPKNKFLTFSSLFEVKRTDSRTGGVKTVKADRNIMQRLITAYEAGRDVNLQDVLNHELLAVPLAIAEMNGQLRSGPKAILAQTLTSEVPCPPQLEATDLEKEATLIVDGQALVNAIGKPQTAVTFGDLADVFIEAVLWSGADFQRIDVLFDRYYELSIKGGTRNRRKQGAVAIRRMIESEDVPLPAKWDNFLAHQENKADLARFLSQQLILKAPNDKTVVAAGGFSNEERAETSDPRVDVEHLEARHEEADTRIILHCVNSQAASIVVSARDTDVLVLLLAHFHRMPCQKVWMKTGTAKQRKYLPIHTIVEHLRLHQDALEALPAFHALTGSDTTSYLAGHTKKTCWVTFKEHYRLLQCLGEDPDLRDKTIQEAEEFVCKLYGVSDTSNINEARCKLFVKGVIPEKLPPTKDALSHHIRRAHFQATVWRQAHLQHPVLPPTATMGWKLEAETLVPVLMSLAPVPESCLELISCSCTTRCMTARCKCKRSRLPCTGACRCRRDNENCNNE